MSRFDVITAPIATTTQTDLPRRLGFVATTAVVLGAIIGSGIFRVPASVAAEVGTTGAVMLVWVLGGIISLCGALTLAELAAAFPRPGGVFVYLREIYGDGVAFLFGWTTLIVGPAGVTGIALIFAEYLGTLMPIFAGREALVTAGVLVAATLVTYRSVAGIGSFVSAASAVKVGAILLMVAAAFLLGDGAAGSLGSGAPTAASPPPSSIGFALVAALWAYNGFHDMVSVAGEVRDPGRVLPRALLSGMLIVIVVYLGAVASYFYVLPFAEASTSPVVASAAMGTIMGSSGTRLAAAMVVISTLGTTFAIALANPRILFAMAQAGLLFAPLGRVHPRFGTPHVAVLTHGALALLVVGWNSFERLAAVFVLGTWPFLAAAAAGVILLRRRRPALERPYLTPGYPVVPMLFVLGTTCVVLSSLVQDPRTTLVSAGFTLIGIPIYRLRRKVEGPARAGA